MKSITKLMVVAMLLVAALVVAPAAAEPRKDPVKNGTPIYVGEENLNLSEVFPGNKSGILVYAPGETNQKTIRVGTNSSFDLLPASVGDATGIWYAYGEGGTPQKSAAGSIGNVYIDIPSSSLGVVLKGTTTSVDGKRVTPGQSIDFRINHNLAGLPGAEMDIEVTTPGGGKVTMLGGESLAGRMLTGQRNTTTVPVENLKAGTYTAKGVWKGPDATGPGYDTNTVTFEVSSGTLAVKADKDSVIRGNSFSITITGESKTDYNVTVKGADPSNPTKSPMIAPSQTALNMSGVSFGETNATIITDASGTASIQFNTTSNAEAKTYTIEVKERFGDKKDEVKVKVEAGSVTITSSGTGTYYIGEEITLSGTCTENETVYLFVTGPNLGSNGVNLTHLGPVEKGKGGSFTVVNVDADDTWSKKWNTGDLGDKSLDAGGYTVYAVSKPLGKDNGLSDAKYATASINLRTGFLSVDSISAAVARGDDLKITGTAHGKPDNVYIWIFGKNYYGGESGKLDVAKASVESDNSFEKKIETKDLAAGQYFVIVQHPMGVKEATSSAGSIAYDPSTGQISGTGINTVKLTGLQAPAAASALIEALESPNIPDTYVKLTFFVEEAYLFIDSIGTKEAGSTFTITGTTNLAVGGLVNIDVTSAAFQPGSKTEASAFSSASGTAVIEKGDGANTWSFEVDATGFKPDQYVVKAESIDTSTTNSATFNMVEAGEAPVTTPPEGETTTPPEGETTTPAGDGETPTEAPPTPGFGALVALAGLGAVAFLVLRRK